VVVPKPACDPTCSASSAQCQCQAVPHNQHKSSVCICTECVRRCGKELPALAIL